MEAGTGLRVPRPANDLRFGGTFHLPIASHRFLERVSHQGAAKEEPAKMAVLAGSIPVPKSIPTMRKRDDA